MKLSSLVTFGAIINTAIHTVNSASSVTTYSIETKCNSILSTCPAVTNNVEEVKKCLSDVKILVRGGDASCFAVVHMDLEYLNQKPIRSTDPNNKDVLYAITVPKDTRININDPDIDEVMPLVKFATSFPQNAKLSGFTTLQVQAGKPDPQHFFTKDPAPLQMPKKFIEFHNEDVSGISLEDGTSLRYLSPDDLVLGVIVPAGAPNAEIDSFNTTAVMLYLSPGFVGTTTTQTPTVV